MVGVVKTKLARPQLEDMVGPIAVGLLAISAAMFITGIWTRDQRWAQTAVVFMILGIGTGIGWLLQ